MRRAIPILVAALALSLVAEAALAAVSGGINIELSRSRRIVLPGAAATISVADPAIADVAVLDAHSIVVIGKAYGVTDIVISDHSGHLLLMSRVSVTPPESQHLSVIRGGAVNDYVCYGHCSSVALAGAPAPASAAAQAQGAPESVTASSPVTAQVNGQPVIPRSPP